MVLVADGLRLRRGEFVLEVEQLRAERGRMLAVTGPSGAGKTTLLAVLAGLIAPHTGTASYDGKPVRRGGGPDPAIAVVLQSRALVASLSVAENLAIALRARGVNGRRSGEQISRALERIAIGDLADRLLPELSGGQLQRVSLARALVVEPAVLLADEPTSELDDANRERVVAALRQEAERGAVVVVTTHDPAVADACDAQLHLDEGRVMAGAA